MPTTPTSVGARPSSGRRIALRRPARRAPRWPAAPGPRTPPAPTTARSRPGYADRGADARPTSSPRATGAPATPPTTEACDERPTDTSRRDHRRPGAHPVRGQAGRRRPGPDGRADAGRPAGPRPRPARGRARRGQDAGGPDARRRRRRQLLPAAVHPGPDAGRHRRHPGVAALDRALRHRARARSSPTWCWPTRSTGPRPRCSRPCSRRWPSGRSASAAPATGCRRRSWCWRPRTRSRPRASTHCPRRSGTGSC